MSEQNKNPNRAPKSETPTLGDVLQFQATIEALPEVGVRNISETERIAISRFPDGYQQSEGTEFSHISLSQRVKGTDRYATVMNYIVLRESDDTTTRIIKRPPFSMPSLDEVFQGHDPFSEEGAGAHQEAVIKATGDFALYKASKELGLYDITKDELDSLRSTIEHLYSPNPTP